MPPTTGTRPPAVRCRNPSARPRPPPGTPSWHRSWTTTKDYESLPPPARGRRRGHNLARALWTLRDACLLFLADSAVPFTNNGAEQALRMAKLQMKISGGFRTRAGAERFARMRGLVETVRKQERNLLELLRQGSEASGTQPNPVPP